MQFIPRIGRLAPLVLAAAVLVAGCGKSKEEQQIEALTLEIQQIEDSKNTLQTQLDSVSRERERILAENDSNKVDIERLTSQLSTANAAAATSKRLVNQLQQQVNQWRSRAEALAKENAQLKDRIAGLTTRVEEAESRAAAAEARAEELQARLNGLQSNVVEKSYYVQKIDVRGFNGNKEFSRERIKSNADRLIVDITISRPAAPAPDLGPLDFTIQVANPKGGNFYTGDFTVTGTNQAITIDVKGQKLDLDKGRHNVRIIDKKDGSVKFESFFLVQSSFL